MKDPRVLQRTMTLNATADEVATLNAAASGLHASTPRDLQLGEIALSNVIILEVVASASNTCDARTGIPVIIHVTVRYYVLPKEG